MADSRHQETFRLGIRQSLSPHKDSEELNRLPREIALSHPQDRSKVRLDKAPRSLVCHCFEQEVQAEAS